MSAENDRTGRSLSNPVRPCLITILGPSILSTVWGLLITIRSDKRQTSVGRCWCVALHDGADVVWDAAAGHCASPTAQGTGRTLRELLCWQQDPSSQRGLRKPPWRPSARPCQSLLHFGAPLSGHFDLRLHLRQSTFGTQTASFPSTCTPTQIGSTAEANEGHLDGDSYNTEDLLPAQVHPLDTTQPSATFHEPDYQLLVTVTQSKHSASRNEVEGTNFKKKQLRQKSAPS